MRTLVPAVAVISLLYACGGQALDVGSNRSVNMSGAGGSTTAVPSAVGGGGGCPGQIAFGAAGGTGPVATPQLPEWPAPACVIDPAPVQGMWRGHVQGTGDKVPDFTLALAAGGDVACGTLVFGEPKTFPESTDAAAAPLGLPAEDPLPGFAYTPLDQAIAGNRIQFRISWAEPWRSWCKLQNSYCDEHYGGYHCSEAANWTEQADGTCTGTNSSGKPLAPFSCIQAATCGAAGPLYSRLEACKCDINGCDADQKGSGLAFDFHVVGDAAQGTVDNATAYMDRE